MNSFVKKIRSKRTERGGKGIRKRVKRNENNMKIHVWQ
jgi:hypothetical protein